jgi:hypothetical protein
MAVRQVKVHGRKVWQARVAYHRLRKSAVCESKQAARDKEADLLRELREKHDRAQQEEQAPATVKALFEAYVADLQARGKGAETVGRAAQTAMAVEAVLPELLSKEVPRITDADIFAFRAAMTRAGKRVVEAVAGKRVERRGPAKPSTVNRDLRTILPGR